MRVFSPAFQVGVDWKTPNQRLKGKKYRKALVPFAEHVLFLPVKTTQQKLNKLQREYGIFLGFQDSSHEYFIGTPKGVFKASSIKRVPSSGRFERANV